MGIPRVTIVGRPNVGKSSILNWLARKRVSVVDPTAGVTRDRVAYLLREKGRLFELIDTGGMGIVDSDQLSEQIERQIDVALSEADLIVFVVDGQAGVVPLDCEVADRLRKVEDPKLLVVNKCDSTRLDLEAAEFHGLCDAPLVITSVKGNRNRRELLDTIVANLPASEELKTEAEQRSFERPAMKLAIVGRRNVGKSTFINALANTERVIVSEVPGTTRDSIDVQFQMDGKEFVAIDTPGVRKRKSLATDIEFYGLVRARRSIRRADVVLMFFDSQQTISKVDKQLVEDIAANYKPCVFVVNKWDLGIPAGMTTAAWSDYFLKTFGSMRFVPVAFVTAMHQKNAKKLVNLAQSLRKQACQRVSTSQLNQVIRRAVRSNPPPYRRNKRPKIYFATQVATEPPTIVLKCNEPRLLDESWKRFLLNVLHEELAFPEVPIKLYLRPRSQRDSDTITEDKPI